MNAMLFSFADALTASASLALIVKVTLILIAAAVLVAVLRNRSAATRHYVWALALATCVALPLIGLVAPTVPLPIAAASESVENLGGAGSLSSPTRTPVETNGALTRFDVRDATTAATQPTAILLRVWFAGAATMLAWLLLGHLGLARLTRRSELVTDFEWLDALDEARDDLQIRRPIQLLRSSAVGAPITWGFLQPIVVLPLTAEGWSVERRRVVLLHELAHVARHDYITQLIAAFACALYWFHPGIWLSARRLRYESERACDDEVLANGTASADYATHLLSVATGSRALRLTGGVAIGMARRSALEGRLLAALDPSIQRAPLSRTSRVLAIAALGIVLVPLAGMRPMQRAVPSVLSNSPISDSATDPSPVAAPNVGSPAVDDSTFERSVRASLGERLYLDLGPGGDVSVRGWDESRVQVRVRLAGDDWRDVSVDIGRDRDGVLVRAEFERRRNSQSTDNSFEIRVPRRFDVRLRSGGGRLTIIDVEGSFEGTTGGGEIVLERVRGHASLSTGGGEIHVDDVNLSGSVSTGGGRVTLSRVSGGLRGHSGSGPIIYGGRGESRRREDTTADLRSVTVNQDGKRISLGRITRSDGVPTLHIEKAGGDIDLAEAPGGAVISTGGGNVSVGRSSGIVEANTGGGDVTIGPVAGSVRAGTGAGTVQVTLVDARGEEQNVEIHVGVGRVILELPSNFDGRFDIETAYTRRFGHATRIESDWDLDRESTDEWDDRAGTPRRYVRGTGSAGRGRGLVYIKTVNGDITIRRGR